MEGGCRDDLYGVLGVSCGSSAQDIRRAYRKLAMQWHPDKWAGRPSLCREANSKFQRIQQAYSVLSDKRKRTIYDAGLYSNEGFSDFMEEMMSLVAQTRRQQEKGYSVEELRGMLDEMARDFDSPCSNSNSNSKRTRLHSAYFPNPSFCI